MNDLQRMEKAEALGYSGCDMVFSKWNADFY